MPGWAADRFRIGLRPRSFFVLTWLISLTGCAGGAGTLSNAPLSVEEQQQQVLTIAPIGTPRNEVATRLKKAGIEFTSSAGDSVYYCEAWQRDDGKRWILDVALLFNESGELYAARRRQADSSLVRGDAPPGGSDSSRSGDSPDGERTAAAPDSDRDPSTPRGPGSGAKWSIGAGSNSGATRSTRSGGSDPFLQ